jgi:hypothetical protein
MGCTAIGSDIDHHNADLFFNMSLFALMEVLIIEVTIFTGNTFYRCDHSLQIRTGETGENRPLFRNPNFN